MEPVAPSFIDETYQRKAVDALLSGFHAPEATHVSMLRAFIDAEPLGSAYAQAREYGARATSSVTSTSSSEK